MRKREWSRHARKILKRRREGPRDQIVPTRAARQSCAYSGCKRTSKAAARERGRNIGAGEPPTIRLALGTAPGIQAAELVTRVLRLHSGQKRGTALQIFALVLSVRGEQAQRKLEVTPAPVICPREVRALEKWTHRLSLL